MRQPQRHLLIAILLATAAFACGCRPSTEPSSAGQPAAPAPQPRPKAKVTAWINVSSGCQQPTVDLLQELASRYEDSVEVEIIDFGQPKGAQRWQEAGLRCMAIEFNGASAVVFPKGGREKVVVFEMPAGFNWTHEDLMLAFAALADGTLRPATEEERQELLAPRMVELHVRAQEVRDLVGKRKRYGQLLVDDSVVARLYGTVAGKSPTERCKNAQLALEKWLSRPVLPSDLSRAQGTDGWGVYANEDLIMIATPDDARAVSPDLTPKALAGEWLARLRGKLIEAAARAREQSQQAQSVEQPPVQEQQPPSPPQ